jgi:hypothetical protein
VYLKLFFNANRMGKYMLISRSKLITKVSVKIPIYAVTGSRFMKEQVCMLIDGKIVVGKITIAKGMNGVKA